MKMEMGVESLERVGDGVQVANEVEGLSVVVPVYNERDGIRPAIPPLLAVLETTGMPYEVLLVDDGSTDGTQETLGTLQYDRVRVVQHERNMGYGAAIKTGSRMARYPWILITDADGTYPPEHIPELLAERHRNDMVVGARTGSAVHVPLLRRPPKWALRRLASHLSRRHIPDLNSGLRLFKKSLLMRFVNILPDRFSLTTTITLCALSSGSPVKYVPINYHKRTGSSKIRPIQDTLAFLTLIFRTIMYFDPLRVFIPVSTAFVLGSIAVGCVSFFYFGKLADVTTVLMFVTGVQLLALGVVADLLNRRLR